MADRSPQALVALFRTRTAVQLGDIQRALDGASRATAFRYLAQVPYRRSYTHNGRFYALHDAARYDSHGLWSHGDVHFSRDVSLKATVRRLVRGAEGGLSRRELRALLRTRVQPCLLAAVRAGELRRESFAGVYLYLSDEPDSMREQLQRRSELASPRDSSEVAISDAVVIEVLLVLIHHPGSQPEDVRRRLRGTSPPIGLKQIRAVFSRYDLGEKGGSSIY